MNDRTQEAIAELERCAYTALETYSNVHRGNGHNSMVSTHLYEQARSIVLEYLGLDNDKYVIVFCTPRRTEIFKSQLKSDSYKCISSQDIGLPLGITAVAVRKRALPRGKPFQTGGGTTRLVSRRWVIWARGPERLEAGTPAIINIIVFARALQLIKRLGNDVFHYMPNETLTTSGTPHKTQNEFHLEPADRAAEVIKNSAADILYNDELKDLSGQKLMDELRQRTIGLDVSVPTMEGSKRIIYLDNAASTPTFIPVWKAVCATWRQTGQVQHEVINKVRTICADFLGAPRSSYDVIFTSNTTEAINLAAENIVIDSEKDIEPVVLNSLLDHNSNDLPWRMLPGILLVRQNVDTEGFMDLEKLENILRDYNQNGLFGKKRIRLVAMCGASNVLGVFNNLEEISRIVHQYGAQLLVDAAQLVAHRKIEMERIGIDYLAFSAHKVYAPFGSGALVVRKGLLKFSPSEMEKIKSSGEANPGGIAALGKMLVLLNRIGLDLIRKEEQDLTRQILNGIAHITDLTIHGIKDPDSPRFAKKGGVIAFHMKYLMSDKVGNELAERRGICVRNGCHCAHLLVKYLVGISPVLEQFQGLIVTLIPGLSLPGVVRVSLGIGNSRDDIDIFVNTLNKIIQDHQMRKQSHLTTPGDVSQNKTRTIIRKQMKDFSETVSQRVYPKF